MLTGLLSCRFSSLADGAPPVGDWVTAPKLKFSLFRTGEPSDMLTSGAKRSLIASLLPLTSGDSAARMLGTTVKGPSARMIANAA